MVKSSGKKASSHPTEPTEVTLLPPIPPPLLLGPNCTQCIQSLFCVRLCSPARLAFSPCRPGNQAFPPPVLLASPLPSRFTVVLPPTFPLLSSFWLLQDHQQSTCWISHGSILQWNVMKPRKRMKNSLCWLGTLIKKHCKEKMFWIVCSLCTIKEGSCGHIIFRQIYKRTMNSGYFWEREWSPDLGRDLLSYCIPFLCYLAFFSIMCMHYFLQWRIDL